MAFSPAFVDTNVFMYAVGREHAMKASCSRVVQQIRDGNVAGVINTEIIQEILHRFRAIGQWTHGLNLARDARLISHAVLPVTDGDALLAMEILEAHPDLPTRDAFHAATMINNKIETIISVDPHFDSIPQVRRIPPEQIP